MTERPQHGLERSRPDRGLARRALALAALVGLSLASVASAQDGVARRRMGVRWVEGVPRVHFSATDLADENVRETLERGLPQTLVMRVYAFRSNGDPLAVAARSCRVTLDLWERVYRVEVQELGGDRSARFATLDGVLGRCLVADRMPIGTPADYAEGQRVYFAVLIELNPVSPESVHRLRRWLARPAAGGRDGGDAFFGSFVSLFINRQIGSAQRTLRFRSQDVAVRP